MAMTRTSNLPLRLVQLGVPALAALVGLVSGMSPMFGIAAALGVGYAALVLSDLALGLALFVVLSFLDNLALGGGLSLAKLSGGVLFMSWLALVATRTDDGGRAPLLRDRGGFVTAAFVLGGWVAMSAVWAEDAGTALGAVSRWALNLSLFPVVYTIVRRQRDVRWIFGLFVLGALLAAAVGLAGAGGTAAAAADAAGQDVRLAGTGLNPNELGQLMILAVVLSGALGCLRELSPPARALAFMGSGLALLALLLTVSRGAILGLVASLLIAPWVIGRGRRAAAATLAVVVIGCGALYIFAFAPQADRDRITRSESTGSGRTDIWKVGLRMVKANPLLGVGADNYAIGAVHYLVAPGEIKRSDHILYQRLPAHNIYLQALAELGPVGLGLLLFIFGYTLLTLLRAARRFAERRERSMELLTRALLIGLCGLLISDFFSTAIYSKQLWLLLATGVAIGAMSRENGSARG